jgi:hypothetical protein
MIAHSRPLRSVVGTFLEKGFLRLHQKPLPKTIFASVHNLH